MILVDRDVARRRCGSCCCTPIATGIFYVLDRTNGEFLSGTPFVHVNWITGFDANGRPIQVPGSNSSPEGSFFVYPTIGGATNFQAPSYSPLTGWMYLAVRRERPALRQRPGTLRSGQAVHRPARRRSAAVGPKPGEPAASAGIKALDPETGKTMWDFKIFQGSLTNGVLATAGNVVFGAIRDGNLVALDATDRDVICGTFRPAATWRPRP